MLKHVFSTLGVSVLLSVLVLGQSAKADPIQDPALNEAMGLTNTCPANCASVSLATDRSRGLPPSDML